MDIELEIHAPGLDLHQERWNNHVLFMDQVHTHMGRIAACAWAHYEQEGRGALFVDSQQWMKVIRSDQWKQEEGLFPCHFVPLGQRPDPIDITTLRGGFREMVEDYDPEIHVVLLVQHHPGEQLSAYLVQSDPSPPEAYRALSEGRGL